MPSTPRTRRIVIGFVAAAIVAGLVWALVPGSTDRPRHILLITVDTLRADALSIYGNPRVRTPHLEALAREGVVFEEARAPSPWTRPSLASIVTGLPPRVHGLVHRGVRFDTEVPASIHTLAEHLKDAGYRTAAFGYNAFLPMSPVFARGFETCRFFPPLDPDAEPAPEVKCTHDDSTEGLTQLTVAWLREHAHEDWFLWIHYFDPHRPYTPAQTWYRDPEQLGEALGPYEGAEPGKYARFVTELNASIEATLNLKRVAKPGMETTAEQRKFLAEGTRALKLAAGQIRSLYEAEVRHVDDAIGRVLGTLRAAGVWDDTLVVMTSDHGEEFWDHDWLAHGHSVHRELVHVPMVIRMPGGGGARRVTEPVSLMSVMPSILDLCAVAMDPEQITAPSLAPFLRGTNPLEAPEVLVAEHTVHDGPQVAVEFEGIRYIRRRETGRREALYRLADDPGELRPFDDPALIGEARRRLGDHRRWTQTLRSRLRMPAHRRAEPDARKLELLRSHGYLK